MDRMIMYGIGNVQVGKTVLKKAVTRIAFIESYSASD